MAAVVGESYGGIMICAGSCVICESGWGSGVSELWVQVVSIVNVYDKWYLLCL